MNKKFWEKQVMMRDAISSRRLHEIASYEMPGYQESLKKGELTYKRLRTWYVEEYLPKATGQMVAKVLQSE